jgi:hypothetical protein
MSIGVLVVWRVRAICMCSRRVCIDIMGHCFVDMIGRMRSSCDRQRSTRGQHG